MSEYFNRLSQVSVAIFASIIYYIVVETLVRVQ
jgi:hypothetical protein